jgi:predicted acyltransferase
MQNTIVGAVSDVRRRIASLDLLRGLAIFLMIAVNSLFDYAAVPPWLKHAPWNGYTISDVVAPMFLFSIGISYCLSFNKRRASQGIGKTILHFIVRYVILFCLGFFGEWAAMGRIGWGVLTMICAVGIYSLAFMFLTPWLRILIALVPFVAYEVLVSLGVTVVVFVDGGLGGPAATVSWGFIVILASAIGNWIHQRPEDHDHKKTTIILGVWGAVLVVIGIVLSQIVPFNKHLVSSSYVVFSTGVGALTLLFFYLLADILRWKIPLFGVIGRNALVLYILSNMFIPALNAMVPIDASLAWVTLGTTVVAGICIGAGFFLDWRKWYVRL